MNIIRNDNFLINSSISEPIYQVFDSNGNVLFNGVTEQECISYLDELNQNGP